MGEDLQKNKFYFAPAKDVEAGTAEWKEMSVSSDISTACLDVEPKDEDNEGAWSQPSSYTFTASVDIEASDDFLRKMKRLERVAKQYDTLRESPQDLVSLYRCCVYRLKPSRKLQKKYSVLMKGLPHMRLTLAYHLSALCALNPGFFLGRWTMIRLLLQDIEEIKKKIGK